MDKPLNNWTALHIHSEYSAADGMIKFEELAHLCHQYGISAVGLSDHRTTSGFIAFDQILRANGIKPLFGVEMDLVSDLKKAMATPNVKPGKRHLTLFARNETGLTNLQRIITKANREGYIKNIPYVDLEIVLQHSDGLMLLSGCMLGILGRSITDALLREPNVAVEPNDTAISYSQKIMQQTDLLLQPILSRLRSERQLYKILPETYRLAEMLRDHGPFFLEIMPNSIPQQELINYVLYRLSQDLNIPLVATSDSHYLHLSDAVAQEVLLAMQYHQSMSDVRRFRFKTNDFYLYNFKQMFDEFRRNNPFLDQNVIAAAMDNANLLANDCNVNLPLYRHIVPDPILEERFHGWDYDDVITELCHEGLKRIGKENDRKYCNRLEMELQILKEKKYVGYLLVVRGIVQWAKSKGIFVGPGRGSAAGSLVCYLLDITQVDPIRHKLMFERFVDLSRDDPPDIDLDFQDDRRAEIKRYLEEIYGTECVASIATHIKLQGKAAFRRVCSATNVPIKDVNYVSRFIDNEIGLESSLSNSAEIQKFAAQYNKEPYPVLDIAKRLEGIRCGKSVHAAGVVIGDRPLYELVAIERRNIPKEQWEAAGAECEFYVAYDKDDLASTGLLKIDILGLKFLTVIQRALESIGQPVNLLEVPLDDPKVYEMLAQGHTIAVFQLETQVMRNMCMRLYVDKFEDLVAANALVRPGAARSGAPTYYAQRKFGESAVSYPLDVAKCREIADILEDTYGVILFQEQIVRILKEVGGFDWNVVNRLRKAISKSEGEQVFTEYREKFVKNVTSKYGVSLTEANALFSAISLSGSYAFSRSHAAAYSVISYWTAWLKYYYPLEYLHAFLSVNSDNEKRVWEAVSEAARLGIRVLPPDIRYAGTNFTLHNGAIMAGLTSVKGIGHKTAKAVIDIRDSIPGVAGGNSLELFHGDKSITDFVAKWANSGFRKVCNRTHLATLLKAGVFDSIKQQNENIAKIVYRLNGSKLSNGDAGNTLEDYHLADKIRNANLLIRCPMPTSLLNLYTDFLYTYFDGCFNLDGRIVGDGSWRSGLCFGQVVDLELEDTKHSDAGSMDGRAVFLTVDTHFELKELAVRGQLSARYYRWLYQSVNKPDERHDGMIVAFVRPARNSERLEVIDLVPLAEWKFKVEEGNYAALTEFEQALMHHPFKEFFAGRKRSLMAVSKLIRFSPLPVSAWIADYRYNTALGRDIAFLTLHDGYNMEELAIFEPQIPDFKRLYRASKKGARIISNAEVVRNRNGYLQFAGKVECTIDIVDYKPFTQFSAESYEDYKRKRRRIALYQMMQLQH